MEASLETSFGVLESLGDSESRKQTIHFNIETITRLISNLTTPYLAVLQAIVTISA